MIYYSQYKRARYYYINEGLQEITEYLKDIHLTTKEIGRVSLAIITHVGISMKRKRR